MLEAVITHPQGLDAATRTEIERYTKLFWINNGPYNNLTARKFVLKTTPTAFAAAVKAAVQAGATVATPAGESLDAMLTRLDADVLRRRPSSRSSPTRRRARARTSCSPAPTISIPASRSPEAEAFKKAGLEKNGLNSRLVKQNGKLVEEVYKVGGRYSKEITAIVSHLEAAIPFAPEATATALRALIQWYRTGDDADRAKYDIAWVADKDSPIDVINGFIEVYLDARGVKGGWESLVFFVNKEKTERIRKLADNAQWFEDHMPFDPKYRKASVKGIVANAIDVVVETGDSGPVTPVGINLPNDQRIREEFGSKSVSLSNVNEAYDKSSSGSVRTRVLVDAGRSRAQRQVRHAVRRAAHRHARGDRPRVGPAGARVQGHAAGGGEGALLGARGRARRSDRAVFHRRSEAGASWASCPPPTRRRSRGPSTRPTPATPSSSCAASVKARRSRKTTCATARWWCGG